MQNERERLIELLEEAKIKALETIGSLNNGFGEWYADHLLANGVIVPPCKVGDTVWWLTTANWQQTDWKIVESKVSMLQQKADKSWKIRISHNSSVFDITTDELGKTVFLTKEEAERALKERSEGK